MMDERMSMVHMIGTGLISPLLEETKEKVNVTKVRNQTDQRATTRTKCQMSIHMRYCMPLVNGDRIILYIPFQVSLDIQFPIFQFLVLIKINAKFDEVIKNVILSSISNVFIVAPKCITQLEA